MSEIWMFLLLFIIIIFIIIIKKVNVRSFRKIIYLELSYFLLLIS